MILFYILLALLVLSSLRLNRKGFNADYLAIPTTNAVKGIFILLVFIKHATPYVVNAGYAGGYVFDYVDTHVGQWIVAMFLFYSGYGIMESIAKKGEAYVNSIPAKRVLTVLVNFAIAVSIFAVVGAILGKTYSPLHYLLSLIGWEAVGNSNWYIFVIMLCYLIAYVSFRKNRYIHTYIHTRCSFVLHSVGAISHRPIIRQTQLVVRYHAMLWRRYILFYFQGENRRFCQATLLEHTGCTSLDTCRYTPYPFIRKGARVQCFLHCFLWVDCYSLHACSSQQQGVDMVRAEPVSALYLPTHPYDYLGGSRRWGIYLLLSCSIYILLFGYYNTYRLFL